MPPQCRHVLQSTCSARPVHAAIVQTGHDMHAELASLTTWPDPPSMLQLCISVDFVSYTCGLRFYAQSLVTVMCMSAERGSSTAAGTGDEGQLWQDLSTKSTTTAPFTRQQKDKDKRRARDKALKEARDKARVEEVERQAVRDNIWQEVTTRHAIWTV